MEWNEVCRFNAGITGFLNMIRENGRNIYEWNQDNHEKPEIDFDRTWWNALGRSIFRRFGISKYYQSLILRNTFQCHYTDIIEAPSFRIGNGC